MIFIHIFKNFLEVNLFISLHLISFVLICVLVICHLHSCLFLLQFLLPCFLLLSLPSGIVIFLYFTPTIIILYLSCFALLLVFPLIIRVRVRITACVHAIIHPWVILLKVLWSELSQWLWFFSYLRNLTFFSSYFDTKGDDLLINLWKGSKISCLFCKVLCMNHITFIYESFSWFVLQFKR